MLDEKHVSKRHTEIDKELKEVSHGVVYSDRGRSNAINEVTSNEENTYINVHQCILHKIHHMVFRNKNNLIMP